MKRKIFMILAIAIMVVLTACESTSSDGISSKGSKESGSSAVTESAKTSTGNALVNEEEDNSYYDYETGYFVDIIYNEKGLIEKKTWAMTPWGLPDLIEWYKYDDNWVLLSSDLIAYYYPDDYEESGAKAIETPYSTTYYKDYLVPQSKEEYKTYSEGYYLGKITEYGENYPSNPDDIVKITEYYAYSESGEIYGRSITDVLNNCFINENLDSKQNVTFSKQYTINKDGKMQPICAYSYSYNGTRCSGYTYYEYDEYGNEILKKECTAAGTMLNGEIYAYYDDHRTMKYNAYLDESYVGGITFEREMDMQYYDLKNTVYSKDGSISEQLIWEYYEKDHSIKNYVRYLRIGGALYEVDRDEYDEDGRLLLRKCYANEDLLTYTEEYVYYPDSDVVQYNYSIKIDGSTDKRYFDEHSRLLRHESIGSYYASVTEVTYYDYEDTSSSDNYKTQTQYSGATLDTVLISSYSEQDELGRDTLWENYDEDGVKISKVTYTYWGDTEFIKRQENWAFADKLYLKMVIKYSEDGTPIKEVTYDSDGSLIFEYNY